jgi:hypothetical protein
VVKPEKQRLMDFLSFDQKFARRAENPPGIAPDDSHALPGARRAKAGLGYWREK